MEDALIDLNSITLSPNPANTHLRIELSDSRLQLQTVQLYAPTGKEVVNLSPNAQTVDINTQELPSGIYLCRVTLNNGEVVVKKVLVE